MFEDNATLMHKNGRFVSRLLFKEPDNIDEIDFKSSFYSAQSMLLKMKKTISIKFQIKVN